MLNSRKLFLFSSLLILFSAKAYAQTSSGSPYSRYGIGDLQFNGFTKNTGMGGISYGYSPSYNLNISNPASYSSLSLTTFETAVNLNMVQMKTSSKQQNTSSAYLSYFAFGFPVKTKKWGSCFGLLPYSNVGYNITQQMTNSAGDVEQYIYQGSGGLNQFFIGNAWSPFRNFSIGANASYLFGVLNQQRSVEFPQLANYLNMRTTQATSIGSMYFNFGMQFTLDSLRTAPSDSIKAFDKKMQTIRDSVSVLRELTEKLPADQKGTWNITIQSLVEDYAKADSLKKHVVHRKEKGDWSLTFGLTGAPQTSLSVSSRNVTESYQYNAIGLIPVALDDTLQDITEKGKLVLPISAGFGVMLKQGNRWLIGSDFSIQNWSDYSLFGESDALANSMRLAVGAQFTPNERSIKSYWQNVQYRLGAHYGKTYLQLRDNQLTEYAVSIGLGLPVRRSAAMLHLSAEAGRRGTISNNLIQENFIRLSIGFTLNDRWFIKSKFD